MRWALYLLGVGLVVVVAFWSFSVTYRTKDTLDEVARLQRAIAVEREAGQVLAAEWAWLNAPDRLDRLATGHEAELGLAPITPEHFGEVAEAPMIQPDDGMAPVALVDLDPVSPNGQAQRRAPSKATKPAAAPTPIVTAETSEPAPHRPSPVAPLIVSAPLAVSAPARAPSGPALPQRASTAHFTAPDR
ncbi:MAG: hypothetical protein WD969_07680 [Paracoccaceae bacterium]